MSDTPEPVFNLAQQNGILPGHGWTREFLDDEGFEEYIAPFIYPFDDEPLLASIVDQAKAQWHSLFPDADERDREMFMAGVVTMQYWWAYQSIVTRNTVGVDPMALPGETEDIYVTLDDCDAFVAVTTTRLLSIIQDIDDEAEADLDDAFSDVIEGFDEQQ